MDSGGFFSSHCPHNLSHISLSMLHSAEMMPSFSTVFYRERVLDSTAIVGIVQSSPWEQSAETVCFLSDTELWCIVS